ncbi:xanthine dehydrogenase family protein subunit M [Pseudonocardia kongjuensis]|uniref:Xanthine dehydrogenase family protein subunit M n=1 Tax=Pseudonocardia kongjuensis TaxID=102227 RepID=A0ABP4ILF1_9PSEU
MKPAAFAYLAPSSVEEAVARLAEHGPEARVLAGGQSLVRLMNTRLSTPSVIIDINRIPELGTISVTDGVITVGAIVRQRSCEIDPRIAAGVPLFSEAGGHVAHVSVRQRGTVVGSVAFADPSAELPAALLALDGQVVVRSSSGERLVDADDFFVGPFRTSLADDELAVAVRIPGTRPERTGSAFVEVSRRHGDLPMCGVGSVLTLTPDGAVETARIALCAVDRRPVRARDAEASLLGAVPGTDRIAEAAALAAAAVEPIGDCHGSASFRRHLAGVLTRRSLQTAVTRAGQENPDAR